MQDILRRRGEERAQARTADDQELGRLDEDHEGAARFIEPPEYRDQNHHEPDDDEHGEPLVCWINFLASGQRSISEVRLILQF